MPIPILFEAVFGGLSGIPYAYSILKTLPWLVVTVLLKIYFSGARNTSERVMHSKVVMMTGGTSGIGASIAYALASRGAQLVLLTRHQVNDPFLSDYIDDLRSSTNNELIYAEQVDLSSLHSIRQFATKWVDNAPPRRFDMVILCANTMRTRFGQEEVTVDSLDGTWGVNYLANFHLLSILSPALRVQPADRDVRVIFGTCPSYIGGELKGLKDSKKPLPRDREYGTSKLALMVFASAFQKHLDAYVRPDKAPNNARVVMVDPGLTRTPGMRRWLTMGSLWGLVVYLIMWPVLWLVLKSPEQGAQSFLRAAMEAQLGRGAGGRFIKECREVKFLRKEVGDEEVEKKLWGFSEKMIEAVEKEGATKRALEKKEKQEEEKKNKISGDQTTPQPDGKRVPGSRRTRKAG